MCIFTCAIAGALNIIIAAVKRCYQNVRRSFMEGQDGKENYVEEQSKRRYRARRQRVCIICLTGFFGGGVGMREDYIVGALEQGLLERESLVQK